MKFQASILTCAAWLAGTLAFAAEAPRLPQPSGPYGIGRVGYDWTDASRGDRLAADPNPRRELMVSLWYPVEPSKGEARGTYLPGAKQMDANPEVQRWMRDDHGDSWPLIVSGAIHSHAVDGAPLAKMPRLFPVVLLSHGLGGSGYDYTALLEDLVSHGYVVAAIEHTRVAGVVAFPDGRLIQPLRDNPPPNQSPAQRFQQMVERTTVQIEVGAADVRFVLDRLTALNRAPIHDFPLAGRLDLTQVAAMGHSAGAEFAVLACERDARFKACVDLDGGMVPVAALPESPDGSVLQQPLLFLEVLYPESRMGGTHEEHLAYFKKKEEQLRKCASGSYDVILNPPGMMHGSFSDTFVLQAGNTPEQTAQALHNLALTESYILAFLDKNLKHTAVPLLDDPSSAHPEATIQQLGK